MTGSLFAGIGTGDEDVAAIREQLLELLQPAPKVLPRLPSLAMPGGSERSAPVWRP